MVCVVASPGNAEKWKCKYPINEKHQRGEQSGMNELRSHVNGRYNIGHFQDVE